jgi:hypothetical protein
LPRVGEGFGFGWVSDFFANLKECGIPFDIYFDSGEDPCHPLVECGVSTDAKFIRVLHRYILKGRKGAGKAHPPIVVARVRFDDQFMLGHGSYLGFVRRYL